jgi:hypothetical protein
LIPLNTQSVRGEQRRLLNLFDKLDRQNRDTLMVFAEFLATRVPVDEGAAQTAPEQPKAIQRPRKESVVAAIRRLSETFFMLDRQDMLNDTASLMGAHVMHGRPAADVIDELESVFKTHYDRYLEGRRK